MDEYEKKHLCTLHGIYNLLSWILVLLIILAVQSCNINIQQGVTQSVRIVTW